MARGDGGLELSDISATPRSAVVALARGFSAFYPVSDQTYIEGGGGLPQPALRVSEG